MDPFNHRFLWCFKRSDNKSSIYILTNKMNHTKLEYYTSSSNTAPYLQGNSFEQIYSFAVMGNYFGDVEVKNLCKSNCPTLQLCLNLGEAVKRQYTRKSKNTKLGYQMN